MFTPPATLEFEQRIREGWTGPRFSGPVSITVTLAKDHFYVTVTELSKAPKSLLRGDIDNYVKSIMDGLNGVAYDDDKQVYKMTVSKR